MSVVLQYRQTACRKDNAAPQWNARPASLAAARRKPVLLEQKVLEDCARRSGAAAARAVQVLTDAALLSHDLDTYSLLQMPPAGVPGLADVIHVMVAVYTLLDNFLLVCSLPRAVATDRQNVVGYAAC